MDEDIDIVVNTISIESILSEKAISDSKQKLAGNEVTPKKKRTKKRKASTDEDEGDIDSPDNSLDPNDSITEKKERRRSSRKTKPNNFYRNFEVDSDSDGDSKKRSPDTEDCDYKPSENETPKKAKISKEAKTSEKKATGSGNVSDSHSNAASRSSIDSLVSTKSSNTQIKNVHPIKKVEDIKILSVTEDTLNNDKPTTLMSISTPTVVSTVTVSPTIPDKSTSCIISNAADSGLFGLGNIVNVTSLRDTKKNGIENPPNMTVKPKANTVKALDNVTLSKKQTQSACLMLQGLLDKTKGLGFLLNSKADGLIDKKVTPEFIKNTTNVNFCIDKTLLLVKLARSNLNNLENEIRKNYSTFVTQNGLVNRLDAKSNTVSTPRKLSSTSTADDDSDCEIIEETSSGPLGVDGKKLSLLKRVEKSGVSWKPTTGSSRPKFGSQEIQLPGQHAVWINNSIMVKKVPQAQPEQQSFFWMDGRTLKPPDHELSILAWDKSKLTSPSQCFDINDSINKINSIGWLNLAFNTYNINSLLSTRKMVAKHKRESCSDLGDSCSNDEDEIYTKSKYNYELNNKRLMDSRNVLNSHTEMIKHLDTNNLKEINADVKILNPSNSEALLDDALNKCDKITEAKNKDVTSPSTQSVSPKYDITKNLDKDTEAFGLPTPRHKKINTAKNINQVNLIESKENLSEDSENEKTTLPIIQDNNPNVSCSENSNKSCVKYNKSHILQDLTHLYERQNAPEAPLKDTHKVPSKQSDDFIPLYNLPDSESSLDSIEKEKNCVFESIFFDNNDCPTSIIDDSSRESVVVEDSNHCSVVDKNSNFPVDIIKHNNDCLVGIIEDTDQYSVKNTNDCQVDISGDTSHCPDFEDNNAPTEKNVENNEHAVETVPNNDSCSVTNMDYNDDSAIVGSNEDCPDTITENDNDCPMMIIETNNNCPIEILQDYDFVKMQNENALKALLQTSSDSDDSDRSQRIKKKVFVKRCQKRLIHDEELEKNIIEPKEMYLKSLLALSLAAISKKLYSRTSNVDIMETAKKTEMELLENEINRLTDLSTLCNIRKNSRVNRNPKVNEDAVKKMDKLVKEVLCSSESIDSNNSSDDNSPPVTEKTDKDLELELQLKSNMAAKHLLAKSSSESGDSSSDSNFSSISRSKRKNRKPIKDEDSAPKTVTATRLKDSLLDESQLLLKKMENDTDSDESKWISKKKRMEAQRLKSRKYRRSSSSKNGSSSAMSNWDISDSDSSEEAFAKTLEKVFEKKQLTSTDEEKSSAKSETSNAKKNEMDRNKIFSLMSTSDSSDAENEKMKNQSAMLTSPSSSYIDLSAKGRKNIRRVIDEASLTETTKKAAIEEENRIQRLLEKNTQMSEYMKNISATDAEAAENSSLVLDFDLETKKPLIIVHPQLVPLLKVHQIDGIKFIWDTCFESVKIAKDKPGGGCIVAHCMGLGKTLQVIALIHSVLTSNLLQTRTVLICCPLSTVLNWVDEFKKWLSKTKNTPEIKLFELSKLKSYSHRAFYLEDWQTTGGVMIMGYEMFRHLVKNAEKLKVKPGVCSKIIKALINPGPDLVVCDEGHLLRNDNTILAKTMKKILTRRRIVLTGTPLQNNLREYYCMVNFVKPNLLGTQKEYINRFVNPIKNGQHKDSSLRDIKIMKKRSHVLHKMLEGCVQRKEVSVLSPYLPKKQEYVLLTTLSQCQAKLYEHYLENHVNQPDDGKKNSKILKDFHTLQKIWTHPRVLKDFCEKSKTYKQHSSKTYKSLSKLSYDLEDDELRDERIAEETCSYVDDMWWKKNIDNDLFDSLHVSHKFSIAFDILDECVRIGDKMLIFSTSLYTLNTLEYFLKERNGWILGRQYYRLDGSVKLENRQRWCRQFNMENNKLVKLFLISTRAGGLGINMVDANRVIIMDVSWNPSQDVQSIFRVYRFGQKKDCYIYRLVALGTMEEKIYERSVTKQAISCRVIDEQQIDRHYNMGELAELYVLNYPPMGMPPVPNFPSDPVLAFVLAKHRSKNQTIPTVWSVHEHDSLLKDLHEEQLDEEERNAAWVEYEAEKTYLHNLTMNPIPKAPLPWRDGYRNFQPGYQVSNSNLLTMDFFPVGSIIPSQMMLNSTFQYQPAVVEDSILPDSNTNLLRTYYNKSVNRPSTSHQVTSAIRPLTILNQTARPRMPARILKTPLRIGQPIRKHYKPSPKKLLNQSPSRYPRKLCKYIDPGKGGLLDVEITEIRGRSCHISPSGKVIKRSPGKLKSLKRRILRTPQKATLSVINEEGASSSHITDLTNLPDTPNKKTPTRRSSSSGHRKTPGGRLIKVTPRKRTPGRLTPGKLESRRKSTPTRLRIPKGVSIFNWYSKERIASSAKKLNFTALNTEESVISDEQLTETSNMEVTTGNDPSPTYYSIQLD